MEHDNYGALCLTRTATDDRVLFDAGQALVSQAAKKKLIPFAFDSISFDRKHRAAGRALHHEIYDLELFRGRVRSVLICLRSAEGSKYGVRTTEKEYAILTRTGRTVALTDAPKSIAAKAAKTAQALGDAIRVCRGDTKLSIPQQPARSGYKIVARTDRPGVFASVWSPDFGYKIGKTVVEKVLKNHKGGLYYYRSLTDAIAAAAKNEVFSKSCNHRRLAILSVSVRGREIDYGEGKIGVTSITPTAEIGSVL